MSSKCLTVMSSTLLLNVMTVGFFCFNLRFIYDYHIIY